MSNNALTVCMYCGNPSVTIMQLSQKSFSLGATIGQIVIGGGGSQYQILSSPLKATCSFCGRKYLIIATPHMNVGFINKILQNLDFEDWEMIAQELTRYGIDPADMFHNVYAIVIPEGITTGVKKWISTKTKKVAYEFHIIFKSREQNFYLSAYRNNSTGKVVGKHIERIL